MAVSDQPPVLRFGTFEVDPHSGELRRNGTKVKLQQQPFQVLLMLLSRAPGIVTREELRNQLWPEDTFVDFEHSVNAAIKRLRDALGDSARNPRFVETLAGRGYRFLAPVHPNTAGAATSEQTPAEAPVVPKPRVFRFGPAAAVIIAFAIGLATFGYLRQNHAAPRPTEKRLTSNAVEAPITNAVLSPDGKYLAYADSNGMYLEQVGTGEIRPMPGPKDFHAIPSGWFPDSTHLLVTLWNGQEAPSIWKISILGGSPQKLSEDALAASASHDGSRIAYLRGVISIQELFGAQTVGREIWIMNSNGEAAHALVKGNASTFTGHETWSLGPPTWSPEGKRVAYVDFKSAGPPALMDIDIEGGAPNTIARGSLIDSATSWAPDGRVLYAVVDSGFLQSSVWSILVNPRTGEPAGSATQITTGPGIVASLTVSADSKKFAVTRKSLQEQTFISDFEDSGKRLSTPRRLTLDLRASTPSAWTPDGKAVLFHSDRTGTYDIFRQQIDQSTPEPIVTGGGNKFLPRLSPDGTSVFYYASPSERFYGPGPWSLMRAPLSGGPPSMIASNLPALVNFQCARSPSTLCVSEKSVENGVIFFVAIDPEHGTVRDLVKVAGHSEGGNWSLSPDGSKLAVVNWDERLGRISFVDLRDHKFPAKDVTVKGWTRLVSVDWSANGRTILSFPASPTMAAPFSWKSMNKASREKF